MMMKKHKQIDRQAALLWSRLIDNMNTDFGLIGRNQLWDCITSSLFLQIDKQLKNNIKFRIVDEMFYEQA